MQETSFEKFGELPKELRLAIWEAAIPGPRVVELRAKPLKITMEEYLQEIRDRKLKTNAIIKKCIENMPLELGWLEPLLSGEETQSELDYTAEKTDLMEGFKSECRKPDILSVCRESYEVAIKFYERTFESPGSLAETWFDFHRDVLYIRWDRFDSSKIGDGTLTLNDWIYDIPFRFPYTYYQRRIENLAILMNGRGLRKCDAANIEEFLAGILWVFGGVKKLTLVAAHLGAHSEKYDGSQLSVVDPTDTGRLEELGIMKAVSGLKLDWLHVDVEELQRLSKEVTEMRPMPWTVPKIEYRIVVPDGYQPMPGWVPRNQKA